MTSELTFIISGFLLGLSGLIPGPLFTLVVSETLKHGIKEGVKVSASPLITDLPIILITILIFSRLSGIDHLLGAIAFIGSAFLIYLAFESLSFKGDGTGSDNRKSRSMRKGIIANFLNPSPYIFWFSIGAPTVVKAYKKGILHASLFVIIFYLTLVGSKVIIALITGKSKNFLSSSYYIYLIRFLGVVLLGFAVFFLKSGLQYFNII
ncbi:LysE family translocator [Thermodesulfobacteriota bacterium]